MENELFEEFDALLKKHGVTVMVEIRHCEYPYNNVEALIIFQNKEYDDVASYKADNLCLTDHL